MESRNLAERKEIERLDGDVREATGISHKNYSEMSR
jgi:hypothetical protein